ncbi:hypothetical protein DH2020_033031 [Rehmannia glutinosa]|uniref:PB1 domain-containing protein n=1 Tax=Rehmannia glutinosa TaxID=99300 RepID=A0ABR0VHI4_REHGL
MPVDDPTSKSVWPSLMDKHSGAAVTRTVIAPGQGRMSSVGLRTEKLIIEFDRDDELFATAGVSRRIKIFEFSSVLNEATDVQCPVSEMFTRSKLSCLSWNKYIKNHIASSDYEGIVTVWDVTTRQVGSADHHIHYYDLRKTNQPLHIFSGHRKAVSYVKFLSNNELASASTDSTLRLWDVKENVPILQEMFEADLWSFFLYLQLRIFRGHANEKNFVGLTVNSEYIACGSETNEAISKPAACHRFISSDTDEAGEDASSYFISAVCWKSDSPTMLTANSQGTIKLKEEGNRRFQAKDYVGALQQYENALKLTPKTHPDRAVFHSNRAACLMQMKPIDYETVISECNLALQVQPRFVRALLRRARAFEAIGKYEMAMQDVQSLLIADPNHGDALEIAGRLRMALGPRQEAQQDLQSRPSPAALGASAVRGAPIAGLGPCLPARPVPKKQVSSPTVPSNKSEKLYPIPPIENGLETRNQLPKVVLKPSNGSSRPNVNASKDNLKEQLTHPSLQQVTVKYRPLKLVYDHDIRLAQMPVNCSFKVLREVVSKRFPMSKAVLIKYKDCDGDLVTITCSAELRLAESSVDNFIPKDPDTEKGEDSIGMLRLHIVEVSPEQEPPLLEEEEEKPLESEAAKGDENVSQSSVDAVDSEIDNTEKIAQKEKTEDGECKEVEMDDWLFEFAQLFRTHVGIDPDAHIDLHEVGMELCSEALEETVTSEEAQSLLTKLH